MRTTENVMTTRRVTVLLIAIAVVFNACSQTGNNKSSNEDHIEEVNRWHDERIRSLEQEDSWLSLVGLYQLEQGEKEFGADSTNDIVFPGKAPAHIGSFIMNEENISIRINPEVEVTHAGDPVREMEVTSSDQGEPDVFNYNSLLWYVIERRGNYYIRLKDTRHDNFNSFDGIDRYPVSAEWRIEAEFSAFDEPETISIPDILGDVYQDSLYGLLSFKIDGETHTLAPLNSPGSDRFFIIFGDETNGGETYGGGRYIYIDTPGEDNTTYIDFNKAYNPPCVFTEFATCPLPPAQNKLPVEVTAGEKMYGES